jgi:hypothetical protein
MVEGALVVVQQDMVEGALVVVQQDMVEGALVVVQQDFANITNFFFSELYMLVTCCCARKRVGRISEENCLNRQPDAEF